MEKSKWIEVYRIVWELWTRPSLEHAAEVWLTGGQTARIKLVSSDGSRKKSVRASNRVVGVAVLGNLGWGNWGRGGWRIRSYIIGG